MYLSIFPRRYKVIVTEERCKRVLLVTWLTSLALSVCEIIYYHHNQHRFNWENILFLYVYPPLQLFFLIVATTTYIFIFRTYKHAKLTRPGSLSRYSPVEGSIKNHVTMGDGEGRVTAKLVTYCDKGMGQGRPMRPMDSLPSVSSSCSHAQG